MSDPMSMRRIVLAGCCLALAAGQVSAESWPRFRGPNGTGISTDQDIAIQWSDKEGILWKTAIPGVGNSSPVIWGDHVFLMSSTLEGKESKERMLFGRRWGPAARA